LAVPILRLEGVLIALVAAIVITITTANTLEEVVLIEAIIVNRFSVKEEEEEKELPSFPGVVVVVMPVVAQCFNKPCLTLSIKLCHNTQAG
jgi:hypothetical protein